MKTAEQIKQAEYLAKLVNDYIVLTKADIKLKTISVTNDVNEITNKIKDKVEEL